MSGVEIRERLAATATNIRQSDIRAVTRRIEARGGVNLGQGTCALPPDPRIIRAAQDALTSGANTYSLFDGVNELKEAVAVRCNAYNRLPATTANVLVTGGATGGLECVCKAFLDPGDEVIVFEPIYQYHIAQIRERGAIPRLIRLQPPAWSFDPRELEQSLDKRTKLLVFANPSNPSGKVFSVSELEIIGAFCKAHGVVPVVDEVYEYILDRGQVHTSLGSLPGMFEHVLTISSASKTFFVTGWRVGWIVGPEEVMLPLGVKSDQTYVCAPTPLQHAVAKGLMLGDEFFDRIRLQFQDRCDVLTATLQRAGLRPLRPQGAYYLLADHRGLGLGTDKTAMERFVDRVGVGCVPGSAFFPSEVDTGLLRFTFAVTEAEMKRACELIDAHREDLVA